MPGVDILIGNNLPLYREVLASTFRVARPDLVVCVVSHLDLDAEVVRARPCLVICSALSETILQHCPSWILLFPDQRDEAIVMIAGQQRTLPHAAIRELLEVCEDVQGSYAQSPIRGMLHNDDYRIVTSTARENAEGE